MQCSGCLEGCDDEKVEEIAYHLGITVKWAWKHYIKPQICTCHELADIIELKPMEKQA
jgi:hypothetical protein